MRPLAAFLLSLAACVSAPARAEEPLEARPTDEAERLALIGDLPGARAAAERLLARTPADGPALFLAACVAVRQTDLDAAEGYTRRLARLSPVPDEAAVLAALVARRRAQPAEPLAQAFGAAWREARGPELKRQLLRDSWARALHGGAIFGLDLKALGRLPPGEAWLVEESAGGAGPIFAEGPRVKELERAAKANGLLVNLTLLGRPACQDVAGLLGALAAARPDDGAFALALSLQGGPSKSTPYAPAELAALEAAAGAARFGLSAAEWRQLEDGLAAQAATAVRRGHRWLARTVTVNAGTGLALTFLVARRRAEATTGPERERTARALLRIGSRLARSPLRLEAMVGSVMETWSATALGDEGALFRAKERRRQLEEEMEMEVEPMLAYWSWPLLALDDDLGPLR